MRDEEHTGYAIFGWITLTLLLLCYAVAVFDGCVAHGQIMTEVHMRALTKYNSVSDQLIDEVDSLAGMWKRYATAQRVFARCHNREMSIMDVNEQDPQLLQKLGDTAIYANEEMVKLMLDIIEQLKQQAHLTALVVAETERARKQVPGTVEEQPIN
jgi:hypothetical protein